MAREERERNRCGGGGNDRRKGEPSLTQSRATKRRNRLAMSIERANENEPSPGRKTAIAPSPRAQRLGDGRRAGAQANKSDSPKSPRGRSNLGAGRLMPPRKRVKAEQKFSAALTSLTTK